MLRNTKTRAETSGTMCYSLMKENSIFSNLMENNYKFRYRTFFSWMVTRSSSSAERIWLCIRLNNAGKWACDWLTEDADFGKKKSHLFRWSSFWSWRVCKQAKYSHLGHGKPVCGFWSRGIIGPFFFENEQGESVTVNSDRYRAMLNDFLFTKIEEEGIGNIWFQ